MDSESTQLFNDRLAQWVAKQGFWFQIRYSMAGGGSSVLAFHVLRIALRLLIFFAVIGVALFAYLVKRTEKPTFKADLRDKIVAGLDGKSGVMRTFTRTQNKASIRHFTLEGGPNSFIDTCEAAGINFRMGLLDGITGTWNANQIQIDRLSLNVKAGAETPEEAATLGRSISKTYPTLSFQTIEAKNTRISWGYSARTMGSISKSHMLALREDNNWRLKFESGVFEQNWLRNLKIVELVMLVNDQGVVVEKGEFTVGEPVIRRVGIEEQSSIGKISFQNVKITGGPRPEFSGSIILENVPLAPLLQDSYGAYLEGSVSGELKLSGSSNSTEGFCTSGRLTLNENDSLSMRNRLHLLNSLSILSPSGSYRKVAFTDGFFNLKTSGGSLTLSDINLTAPDQMDLTGAFTVRPPKQEEIDEMLRKGAISTEVAQVAANANNQINYKPSDELTLKKAVKMANQENGDANKTGFKDDIIDIGTPFQAESFQLEQQMRAAQKLALTSIFEGKVQLKLPVVAFPKDSPFLNRYPKSTDGSLLLFDCPLDGSVFDITFKQAEDLLLLEKNKPAAQTNGAEEKQP